MVFELTIDRTVYQFNFGFGFLREVQGRVKKKTEGVTGREENLGLYFLIAGLEDGNIEDLCDALIAGNKGQDPRLTRQALEAYLEDPDTDIDQIFADLLDFLSQCNCTKKTYQKIQDLIARQETAGGEA